MASLRSAIIASFLALAAARDIPDNVKALRDSIVAQKECKNALATGFHSKDNDDGTTSYCGDHLEDYGIIYFQGKNGELTNIDTDCDGVQDGPADDGRCKSSTDTQTQTSFDDIAKQYGIDGIDPFIHGYVVFGNEADGRKGWPTFDPQAHGVEPLSLMAVVCGDKLIYGVWGDSNGGDGDEPMAGEASISIGTACYGTDEINGNQGHEANDVLFIAFTGGDAAPGASADWTAQSYEEFSQSISDLGDKLISRIGEQESSRHCD
ncbi:Endo-chitosanase [Cladobotryum mycophilum]|uniref:Endo-chitosanase n=1 Tax=Cladobotryum mycophilum TaxID=491253 RepID=A0ABR0SAL1_9HYPO